jgi:hypothetical protein
MGWLSRISRGYEIMNPGFVFTSCTSGTIKGSHCGSSCKVNDCHFLLCILKAFTNMLSRLAPITIITLPCPSPTRNRRA